MHFNANCLTSALCLQHPHLYTYSLLFAIEKKGNLSKPCNYRGIQMMQAIACIYDRIIGVHLLQWLPVRDEQTTYQQGIKYCFPHIDNSYNHRTC